MTTPEQALAARLREENEEHERTGLRLLNVLREHLDDQEIAERVSLPGDAEPGEFYVTVNGHDYAIRVEAL